MHLIPEKTGKHILVNASNGAEGLTDDAAHSCPEADRVIIKPIMFNELLDTIMECLEERQ